MYLDFYKLADEPFRVTPDPEFLFLTDHYREALAAIVYGITARKGFVAITGEVGVGKTTILRSYLDTADRKGMRFVYIFTPTVSFEELVTVILRELNLPVRDGDSVSDKVQRLHEELIRAYKAGDTVVLFVDEAHNMPVATLESLRMLSNLETATGKLIQIILVGQPELEDLLQRHELRQLNSRIAVRTRIGNMSREDSLAYMRHRLSRVQLDMDPVFTDRAMAAIADQAGGIPRAINVLADNALITGFGYKQRPIDIKVVREVIADVTGARRQGEKPKSKALPLAAAIGGLMLAGAVAAGWYVWSPEIPLEIDTAQAQPPAAQGALPAPVAAAPVVEPPAKLVPGMEAPPQTAEAPAIEVQPLAPPPVSEPSKAKAATIAAAATTPPPAPKSMFEQWIDAATTIAFSGAAPAAVGEGRVVVRHGDTLTTLVRASYGNSEAATLHWVLLHNPEVRDPDVLYVGQVLNFPAVPANALEAKAR